MKSIKVPQLQSWEKMAGIIVTEEGELHYWLIFCSLQNEEKSIKDHSQSASLLGASVASLKEIDICLTSFPDILQSFKDTAAFVSLETLSVDTGITGTAIYVRRVPIEEEESSAVPPSGPGSISLPLTEQRLNAGGN